MPTTSTSLPSGQGGVIGVPSTRCSAATGIGVGRPGRASSGATMTGVFQPKNMARAYRRAAFEDRLRRPARTVRRWPVNAA